MSGEEIEIAEEETRVCFMCIVEDEEDFCEECPVFKEEVEK
jgi:hypothetical protein